MVPTQPSAGHWVARGGSQANSTCADQAVQGCNTNLKEGEIVVVDCAVVVHKALDVARVIPAHDLWASSDAAAGFKVLMSKARAARGAPAPLHTLPRLRWGNAGRRCTMGMARLSVQTWSLHGSHQSTLATPGATACISVLSVSRNSTMCGTCSTATELSMLTCTLRPQSHACSRTHCGRRQRRLCLCAAGSSIGLLCFQSDRQRGWGCRLRLPGCASTYVVVAYGNAFRSSGAPPCCHWRMALVARIITSASGTHSVRHEIHAQTSAILRAALRWRNATHQG